MAFSYYNSSTYSGSTLVLLLGTPFNTILYFSDNQQIFYNIQDQNSIRAIILMSSWLIYLVNSQILLQLIKLLVLILIQVELKLISLILLITPSLTSFIIFCFNIITTSMLISCNLT